MSEIEKGVLQPKTLSIKWEIERFFADCEKLGDSYVSQIFPIDYDGKVTNWYLRVYPKGRKESSKDYVGLYLIFQSDDGSTSKVTVDYRLSIVSKQDDLSRLIEAKTFKGPAGGWGWDDFYEQNVIKDTKIGALIDDTLTILCDITFSPTAKNVPEELKVYDDILNKIGKGLEDYGKLLENNYFSDVTFNIQDKKMHLHKAILMCRNSVFKAMFEHDMKENKECLVDITDVDYEIMKELIRFIYSGKVENIEKIAKDLLVAADKYAVTELKALCEKTLCQNLTVDNAVEYLRLIQIYDTIHLKTLVIKFVAAHYKDVIEMPGFANLSGEIMYRIMQAIAKKN